MTERLPLSSRLWGWITSEASPAAAECFVPSVLETLSEQFDLAPETLLGESQFSEVQALLRRASITPSRLERALSEARRASEEGLSTLQWAKGVQSRAVGNKMAEDVHRKAEARLKSSFSATEEELQEPPSPKEILTYLLAWEEMGGSSTFAAFRELRRQRKGCLPQN